VWIGHSSDQAPQDFSVLDDDALKRFLQQAGASAAAITTTTTTATPATTAGMNHEELVSAARSSRGAWEVERIVVGCSLPEQVLRVQKSDRTDPVVLKAAWKKLAFQVHPDRCSAEGASVAMAIAKDAFDILAWRAEQYQAEAAFARENETKKTKTHAAAKIATVGASEQNKSNTILDKTDMAKSSRPLSAPTDILPGGHSNGSASVLPPQPPLKLRVKLKVAVKKLETPKPLSSSSFPPEV
jgi:hypothetical protein